MASSAGLELLVVRSNLTSTIKTLFKKNESPHVKDLINTLPGPPEIGTANCYTPTRIHIYIRSGPEYPAVPGEGSVIHCIRLNLGSSWSVNLLPVAQRTNASTWPRNREGF